MKKDWVNPPALILLDLGGVVFASTGRASTLIDWQVITRLNHLYGHALNVGEDVFADFMRDYNQATKQSLSGPTFLKEVFDTLTFNAELVQAVRKYGPIFIVSDNYRENIAYITKRYQFDTWAQRQFYSYDFQLVKGDPPFFAKLNQEIPSLPTKVLIDDSHHKLVSARKNGIAGIQYRDNRQVLADLKRYRQSEFVADQLKCGLGVIDEDEKEILFDLLPDYLVEVNGKATDYPYAQAYWQEERRIPLWVYCNDEIAGFVLLNQYCLQASAEWSIAEFYVMPGFRRKGIGAWTITAIFDLMPMRWEVAVAVENEAAAIFWRHTLNAYAKSSAWRLSSNENLMGNQCLYLLSRVA